MFQKFLQKLRERKCSDVAFNQYKNEKILMVLGGGFIEREELKPDIFTYTNDDYLEEKKYIYKVKEKFEKDDYLKIYSKKSNNEEENSNS